MSEEEFPLNEWEKTPGNLIIKRINIAGIIGEEIQMIDTQKPPHRDVQNC